GCLGGFPFPRSLLSRWIDLNRSSREPIVCFFSSAASQDRLDPQNNFAGTEWFRHVIVRAAFKANDPVDLLCPRGQHQNWNVAGRCLTLYNFANLESGDFRQHQIENDEVRLFRTRFGQSSGTVAGLRNKKATRFAQIKREKVDNVVFVFDDENSFARHRVHARETLLRRYFDRLATRGFAPAFSFRSWVNS